MTRKQHFQRRRDFLQIGGLSMMGLGLPSLLASESMACGGQAKTQPAKNVILVWLAGGPSTIDMWDLKPDAPRAVRGEFLPINTSADGIRISEHLPKTAKQMHLACLVRSVRHTIAEHGQGTEYVLTGNQLTPALQYPSLGSVVAKKVGTARDVPVYVDLSGLNVGKAGYLSSNYNPFVVEGFGPRRGGSPSGGRFALTGGLTEPDLDRRSHLLSQIEEGFARFDNTGRTDEMSEFQQQAVDILRSGKTRDALDIQKEPNEVVQRYGFSRMGASALAARRLIQAGVRFVTIGMGGWDTHSNNFGQLRDTLLPRLDTSLAALMQDLDERGLLDSTLVYCVGEFNRTPNINAQGGRDHWARSMSVFLAGGGLKRGFVYGSTDVNGMEPEEGACGPADVNATIVNQLGISPQDTLTTNSGRPIQLFKDGRVLDTLVDS